MTPAPPSKVKLQRIRDYISRGWDDRTRSVDDCATVADPKLTEATVVYLPAAWDVSPDLQKFSAECNVRVERLPFIIREPGQVARDKGVVKAQGLLFLENPYVVPGKIAPTFWSSLTARWFGDESLCLWHPQRRGPCRESANRRAMVLSQRA